MGLPPKSTHSQGPGKPPAPSQPRVGSLAGPTASKGGISWPLTEMSRLNLNPLKSPWDDLRHETHPGKRRLPWLTQGRAHPGRVHTQSGHP